MVARTAQQRTEKRVIGMLAEPGRYDYLPLIDRPRIRWPNDARVAFWVGPNIEFYELDPPDGQGRPLWPRPHPDILNYSLRDYGNRVGIWRVMEALERFGVRASVSLNAAVCDHMPEIINECVRLKWELFSHGIYNTRLISGMAEDEVRHVIRDSLETIRRHSGQDVVGWLAPAISTTETFFDLLPEFGIKYTVDMVPDDQPIPIKVRTGRLIAIPYSTEINDVRVMGVRGYPADKWASMMKACFDQLYLEGADNGMVVCMPLHPFVVGQPHRIDALHDVLRHVTSHERVWLATAREIADWYYRHHYDEALSFRAAKRVVNK
jgi:allantoinase